LLGEINPTVTRDGHGAYWISLTPKDYETLSKNLARIRNLLKYYYEVAEYYKTCINDFNRSDSEAR
jgi:hypothetical protein